MYLIFGYPLGEDKHRACQYGNLRYYRYACSIIDATHDEAASCAAAAAWSQLLRCAALIVNNGWKAPS